MLQVGEDAPRFSVQPVFGLQVELHEQTRRYPLVLCFLPHTGSPWCREAMFKLQEAYASFDLHGAQVLVITPASMDVANDYVPRYHILFPVVCDPQFELFSLYSVPKGGAAGALKSLRPDRLVKNLRALKRGLGPVEGVETQLPAFFVIAPGGKLVYARYGGAISDQPDVDALLEAARGCC